MNINKIIKNDKRKSIRFDVDISCLVYFFQEEIEGSIKNISTDGALILLKKQIEEKENIKLFFALGEEKFILKSKIINKEDLLLKIKFVYDFNENSKEKIAKILRIIDLGEDI